MYSTNIEYIKLAVVNFFQTRDWAASRFVHPIPEAFGKGNSNYSKELLPQAL